MTVWRPLWRQKRTTSCSRLSSRCAEIVDSAFALVYPPTCPLCQGALPEVACEPTLCQACQAKIRQDRPQCPRCARPVPAFHDPQKSCARCRTRPPRVDRTLALGVYTADLKELVLRIKQPGNEPLAFATGRLMAAYWRDQLGDARPNLIVPTPVHWSRRIVRGFNCPELLAESISRNLSIPLAVKILRTTRRTQKQGLLLPTERAANVRRAYRVPHPNRVRGKHIMIVDDVMTTGATANEIARVLRRAGASGITLAVVARGIGFDGK